MSNALSARLVDLSDHYMNITYRLHTACVNIRGMCHPIGLGPATLEPLSLSLSNYLNETDTP
jgi:hypothetical protein